MSDFPKELCFTLKELVNDGVCAFSSIDHICKNTS